MIVERDRSNQFGSSIACTAEHEKVIDCVQGAQDKNLALVHLWCVQELDDLSYCVHSQGEAERRWKAHQEDRRATKYGVHETAAQKTIKIPITEGPVSNVATHNREENGSKASISSPSQLISALQSQDQSSIRRSDPMADSEMISSRKPIFDLPQPPPLYRGKDNGTQERNSALSANAQSTQSDRSAETSPPTHPVGGFLRFIPWFSKKDETELSDMMKSALSEAKSMATTLAQSIPELPMEKESRTENTKSDQLMFERKGNQEQQKPKSTWNGGREIRSPFCPLYWFQSFRNRENDPYWFRQEPDFSQFHFYNRDRDHARSAHYHQDIRKDRFPIYRSQWIDDEKQQQDVSTDNDTRVWVDQVLGACNAMSHGKTEKDRLNRFAVTFERIQAVDPVNQKSASNKLYHDNVGMLQAFQFCLALENLGRQLPATTSAAGSCK